MSEQFNISSSPHIRSKVTTSNIMMLVTIALLPTTIFGVYNFGLSALGVVLITTGTAVLTEYLYQKLMHKKVTIQDFSAVVTGLLLALNLPPTAPWWMCVLGSVFAILVVKQLFGGLGQNFMNPALGARCFLLISFTEKYPWRRKTFHGTVDGGGNKNDWAVEYCLAGLCNYFDSSPDWCCDCSI